ncbi:MAG: hypothetical protein ACQESR_30890 [Planctomycetota bacterium]
MESCPMQAVLPPVGLAAHQVIRDRYSSLSVLPRHANSAGRAILFLPNRRNVTVQKHVWHLPGFFVIQSTSADRMLRATTNGEPGIHSPRRGAVTGSLPRAAHERSLLSRKARVRSTTVLNRHDWFQQTWPRAGLATHPRLRRAVSHFERGKYHEN